MQSRQFLSTFLAFLLALGFYAAADSQTKPKIEKPDVYANEQAAIAKLRELYIGRDFETGYELGQKLAAQFPESIEVKAWTIVNLARDEMPAQAVEAAKKLVAANPQNGWANFALAHAYVRSQQTKRAIPIVEKVFKLLPDNEEVVFLDTSLLLSEKKYDEIYALLDKNSATISDQARALYIRGEAEYRQALEEKNSDAKKKQSFETFAKAIKIAPNSVGANYVGGVYLYSDKRFAEALPVLKKAVALAPQIAHVRQAYWRALLAAQPKKTAEQKTAEVLADINEFLRLRPNSISAFDTAASFYGRELQMPDRQSEIEQKIVEKFPESLSAEQILFGRIMSFRYANADDKIDEKKKAEFAQLMKDYINRPQHFNQEFLAGVYQKYFYQIRYDKNISNQELLRLAEKISEQTKSDVAQTHSMIVSGLSERQMYREAENFVAVGFEKLKEEIAEQRELIKDENRNLDDLNSGNATLYAARGWLFYKEKRFDDAEKDLLQAVKLNGESSYFYTNLGQIYEAKNDPVKAEDAYINAYSTFFAAGNRDNPNLEKLKNLYQKRNGNLNNFDDYFERAKVAERARRKERITKARIENAEPVTPFVLKNLDAKIVSSADLRGKIVVVNIWGTWCAPCVGELPEFQELSKKYRNDKDVVILTINNDEDANLLKNFMTAKKYDFTVLRDEKYLDSVGINAFPTTWFIDRDGKIAYVKIGMSDKLTEEFGWRIEELKNPH